MNVSLAYKIKQAIVWLILVGGAVVMLSPFFVMLSMSLKTPHEVDTTSPMSWPAHPVWGNYLTVLGNPNVSFWLFLRNTVYIAVFNTIGVLITSSLVAYAFARLNFRGRDRLFLVLISTMMLPGIVTMIPTYIIYKYLHWIDTFYPLIVPAFLGGGAYNVFLLRQFFMGLPKELDEAAFLDGASYSTIFWRIVLPLSGPALATVSVFTFIYNWKDFMGPLIYLNDPDKQTLELGLNTYNSLSNQQWHLIMAASVMVMLPLLLIFLFSQRYVVKGVVMSGLK
jgi:ABC-type glycerol-3-phosphate transport system permease component